jgi:hypothetical protein
MKLTRVMVASAVLLLGSCGHVADLKPASGQPLPLKPMMARAALTPNELLAIPTYAKPSRVDELMKRSEPRPQDPFNLPPPTGGSAPSLPPGNETEPVANQAAPTTPGD